MIFLGSLQAGKIIAKKFSNRVTELKEMKNALNMFLTKIKFTYESVPESFSEIGNNINGNTGKIFRTASELMKEKSAGEAWEETVDAIETSLTEEDKGIIKNLGRMLGKTDLEGQVSEIKLVQDFLNTQIEVAEKEKQKNEKLYRTLGGVVGLAIVIILVWEESKHMDIDLLFKIAAIGILVAVLHQVLVRAGREDQAMMTTLAGLVIVLTLVIKEISTLFDTVRTMFGLWCAKERNWLRMDIVKVIGIGLISLIIIIIVRQYKPEFTLYVSLLAGALILLFIMDKLEGIIDLLTTLSSKTAINNEFLVLLIKITGIAFLTEFAVSLCKDTGESAIASKIDMGGKVIIVSMSIPIISSLLETVVEILP